MQSSECAEHMRERSTRTRKSVWGDFVRNTLESPVGGNARLSVVASQGNSNARGSKIRTRSRRPEGRRSRDESRNIRTRFRRLRDAEC